MEEGHDEREELLLVQLGGLHQIAEGSAKVELQLLLDVVVHAGAHLVHLAALLEHLHLGKLGAVRARVKHGLRSKRKLFHIQISNGKERAVYLGDGGGELVARPDPFLELGPEPAVGVVAVDGDVPHLPDDGLGGDEAVVGVDDAALPQHAGEVADLGLLGPLGVLQLHVEAVAQLEHLLLAVAGLALLALEMRGKNN